MASVNFWLLGVLSCCLLTGLGYAGLLVSRESNRQEKLARRIEGVLSPHMRSNRIELSAFIQNPTVEPRSLFGRMADIFGFDAVGLDRYPVQWWMILIIAAVVAKIAQSLASDMIGQWSLAAMPVAWVMLSRMAFNFFEKRYRDKLLHQLPDALAMVVRAVRVGIPVLRAINNVARDGAAPTRELFAGLVNQISVGVALDEAVMGMARRSKMPEYRFFATAISLQMQTGGALSETLENLADVIRKRVALKARAMALASEARTSAMVLAALPFVSGTALYVLNPDYIGKLFHPGLGETIFSGAVLSLGLGLLVMRSLIRASLA
jgi:tight adherence protein B